jgi:hypothetical protein
MDELSLFEQFIKGFLKTLGFEKEAKDFRLTDSDSDLKISAEILQQINGFLYVADTDVGKIPEYPGRDYISRFHRFWRKYHPRIINPTINEEKCRQVAQVLERIHATYGSHLTSAQKALFTPGNIHSLTPRQIANIRFFSITQDFKIRFQVDPYSLASEKPNLFDARTILSDYPAATDELLHELGAETQTDKRHKFSRLCAEFLIEKYEGDAFNICPMHDNDALAIRQALIENSDAKFKGQLGFSDKKANLLIRDLVAMEVWSVNNPEEIDVSSDANTMRVALRTGILRTRAPLLTSYVDVYDYQYGLIDEYTKRAWRRVWEIWGTLSSNHRVQAPAMFDFLIYRIGQNCCKTKTRRCDVQCNSKRIGKCGLKSGILTDCSGWCAFKGICDSASKKLNPPRAISILGGTGWEDGRTDEGGGKGISA